MNNATVNKHFDVIVIGVGSMGSAACYQIAARGYSVLGLEQFDLPHEWGSHGGQSRIIRKAYYEHPDYIPLLQKAYENWKQLEAISGQQIYYPTGLLYAGPAGHEILEQVGQSAAQYRIALETLDRPSCQKRFPQFHLPEHFTARFEPDAGFLTPEKAITAYAQLARQQGAVIHTREKVLSWMPEGSSLRVNTDRGTYSANRLIIAGGAWAAQLIPDIAPLLKVTRQVLAWFQPPETGAFGMGTFPCWLMATDNHPGAFYGFPDLPVTDFGPHPGIKLALHHPDQITDPDRVDRTLREADTRPLAEFLKSFIPSGYGPLVAAKTCLYSNSPDEHFIIDHLPGTEKKVTIAWGFSGHGFKFASALGEVLADLAIHQQTAAPIEFLRIDRLHARKS